MVLRKTIYSTKRQDYETPFDVFYELNEEFNFTLDPCSNASNAKCNKYYTIKENGLKQNWSGNVVFMNPPSKEQGIWVKKAYDESVKGATVVCLLRCSTGAGYWHDIIFPFAVQIRFIRGRLPLSDLGPLSKFSNVVVVFSKTLKYTNKIKYYPEKKRKQVD